MSIRKQSLLTVALLAVLVVASCFLEQASAKKHRSRKIRPKLVNIEIYRPKGVLVWHPYQPDLEMFGIEIFLNQRSEDAPGACYICLNTTTVTYGKFILRSDDAIIRSRDHVTYNAILKKTTGEEYTTRSHEFYVSESRILSLDLPGAASEVASRQDAPTALQQEIVLLEEILGELNDQCSAVDKQTKQLLLEVETPVRLDAAPLYQFVKAELAAKLPTIDWQRTLVDAYYASSGITFEVPTIVDKLKILKLAKQLPEHAIDDPDTLPTDDDSANDIDNWIVV